MPDQKRGASPRLAFSGTKESWTTGKLAWSRMMSIWMLEVRSFILMFDRKPLNNLHAFDGKFDGKRDKHPFEEDGKTHKGETLDSH
jgi:hypothetical protein